MGAINPFAIVCHSMPETLALPLFTSLRRDEMRPSGNLLSFCAIYA